MRLMGSEFQLVGFLVVTVVILASLVAAAIGIAVSLIHDRPKDRDRQAGVVH